MQNNTIRHGYSTVNGIRLYHEISGHGEPLLLLHGGGSTIPSSFGRLIPLLAKSAKVIAVELQNHGRTGSRNIPQTFEQDADDVAVFLNNLGIHKASILGFSNGATTAMLLGSTRPQMINKLIVIAGAYKRNGFINGFFEGMAGAVLEQMPGLLQAAFLDVNPSEAGLQIMFERDRDRMIAFKDYPDEMLKKIEAPTLIIHGDADVVTVEHAVAMHRLIPDSRLTILPGGHGQCIGEITTCGDDDHQDEINFTASLIARHINKPQPTTSA